MDSTLVEARQCRPGGSADTSVAAKTKLDGEAAPWYASLRLGGLVGLGGPSGFQVVPAVVVDRLAKPESESEYGCICADPISPQTDEK